MYYFLSYFGVALVLSLCMVPLMRPLALKVGAVDRGEGRRIHTGIIPRLGGVGIYFAFIIPMVFSLTQGEWDEFHDKMAGIVIASTIVLLVGIYDDLRGAGVRTKLLVEVLAALTIYAMGIRITIVTNPFGGVIVLGWLSLPITVLWIIVITNAINLIDGLDGLAAGTGILIALTLFFSGITDAHLRLTLVILAGSLIGFLRYNFPPASIFMGDSGSLFIGFLLAAISIVFSRKATAMATIMIPLIVFSIPLMDMLYAVLRRFYRGMPLGEADREHIHHKLLERGLSKKNVLLVLYIINFCIMFLILLIVRQQLGYNFIGLALLLAFVIIGFRAFGYIEFIPFFKEVTRNYKLNSRRRYYNYVLKKFKCNAYKANSPEDLKYHLTALMNEYKFNAAEVHLDLPVNNKLFFYFNSNPPPDKPVSLTFPITHKNLPIGRIFLTREMNGSPIFCVDEMVNTLSEEIGSFVERNYKTFGT